MSSAVNQSTFAMIKPGFLFLWAEILSRIIGEGLCVKRMETIEMNRTFAEKFYAEHSKKSFFPDLINYMTSNKSVLAFEIVGSDAIEKWRSLMGPTNRQIAISQFPNSLRALYGRSTTENVCHGSDSQASAAREIKLVFGDEEELSSSL